MMNQFAQPRNGMKATNASTSETIPIRSETRFSIADA
jgi:hypothetical protein